MTRSALLGFHLSSFSVAQQGPVKSLFCSYWRFKVNLCYFLVVLQCFIITVFDVLLNLAHLPHLNIVLCPGLNPGAWGLSDWTHTDMVFRASAPQNPAVISILLGLYSSFSRASVALPIEYKHVGGTGKPQHRNKEFSVSCPP